MRGLSVLRRRLGRLREFVAVEIKKLGHGGRTDDRETEKGK